MSKSEEHYIVLMHRYASELARDVREEGITPERLGRSTLLQRSVTKGVELIGEAAWQLKKLGADLGPSIPLSEIAGMRHMPMHHYDGVDWNTVEEVALQDVPQLEAALAVVMEQRGIKPPATRTISDFPTKSGIKEMCPFPARQADLTIHVFCAATSDKFGQS